MTPIAIVFLVASISLLWGGLAWSIVRLRQHPDIVDDDDSLAP